MCLQPLSSSFEVLSNFLIQQTRYRIQYISGDSFPRKTDHDDVIKWKHFPRYWPLVRGIDRWPVNSPHKRPVTRSFDVFFYLRPNKRLSKQSWGWWFQTLSCSLWRHCNGWFSTEFKALIFYNDAIKHSCLNVQGTLNKLTMHVVYGCLLNFKPIGNV